LGLECMSRKAVPLCVLVLLLVASSSRAPAHTIEGTVLAFAAGQSLIVVNEQTDPSGVEFFLRHTRIEPRETLRPGARVKVWYRAVGEHRPIVDRIHVLGN